jgi:orotidine-5'-phosphate decarboxylase
VNYADRLDQATQRVGNACLLGIDPHINLLPDDYAAVRDAGAPRAERAQLMGDFCCELIDLAAGRIAAVKPQSAFFEELGADGIFAWERVVRAARDADLLVIGDVKRGDIASTASAYARTFLQGTSPSDEGHLCDAITVNPYLGADSIEPMIEACEATGRGLYILVRTSNPGSADFQLHGTPNLWEQVAARVNDWGAKLMGECGLSSIGAVVGATHADDLANFRAKLPNSPLLLPGYGAQGATAKDLSAAFLPNGRGALINSSRGIAFAYRDHPGAHWKDAARTALDAMIAELSTAVLNA